MKPFLLALGVGLIASSARAAGDAAPAGPVYELRIYTATPGNLDQVLARFRDHTLAIFARHGMASIGYWTPADAEQGAGQKLVYLLRHPSREAAAASWKAFQADPEWQSVKAASEARGKLVAEIRSVFLAPTDYSPVLEPSRGATPRVFELRTYTTPEGGLPALDARFRGGETDLFAKSGLTGILYTHPTDAAQGGGRTLVYLLVHPSREAAAESWKKFRADPAWLKMKADSEKPAGPLTTKVESMFLISADFSPLR